MHTERITFTNADGLKLAARVDRPLDDDPVAWALFAHCFTCSKDYKAVANVSRALAAQRIAVLRFDFTGLGESEGEFSETAFSSNVDDLLAAAGFMERELGPPQILIGHSLGGAAVLHAARRVPSTRAVVTIAAPSSPRQVLRHLEDKRQEIEESGQAEVSIGGRSFTIRREFVDDLQEVSMNEVISELDRALLILHSPVDNVVGIDHAAAIFKAARHPKSFVSLDRADHLLTDPSDSRYVASVIAGWARKYIAPPAEAPRQVRPQEARDAVTARTEGGYRTTVLARGHTLVSDEPENAGGTDRGPTPYELLSAALAACSTITVRMYADRKGWSLAAVEAVVRHRKIAEEGSPSSDQPDDAVDRFEREMRFEGDLDEDQRRRLLEIADRCPVHRTLHREAETVTTMSDKRDARS